MNYRLFAAGLLTLGAITAARAQGVGVSINVGQPGFYGRIELGSAPPPQLVYSAPVVVERYQNEAPPPIYLHVPPGHERHWKQHCREYNACGVPVYFVRDRWYNDVYVNHYRDHRGEYERHEHVDRDRHEDHGNREDQGEHRGRHDDDGRDHDRDH